MNDKSRWAGLSGRDWRNELPRRMQIYLRPPRWRWSSRTRCWPTGHQRSIQRFFLGERRGVRIAQKTLLNLIRRPLLKG